MAEENPSVGVSWKYWREFFDDFGKYFINRIQFVAIVKIIYKMYWGKSLELCVGLDGQDKYLG